MRKGFLAGDRETKTERLIYCIDIIYIVLLLYKYYLYLLS